MLGLLVGQRGAAARAPVDDVFAAVDESFVVQLHEHFSHRAGEPFVHGEALPVPVARRAELLELVGDGRMVLFLPAPHFLDKRLPAQVVAGLFLLGELLLNNVLRGNAGMVGARHPQGLEALHAFETDENVLDRVVERVAHVKNAGHVGRRDHNRILRFGGILIGMEMPPLHPGGIPFVFDARRVVLLFHWARSPKPQGSPGKSALFGSGCAGK